MTLWYFKLILRCKITSQNIWFFNCCLRNNVTPRYIKLKSNNSSSSAKKAQLTGQRKWIIEDRKTQYNTRNICNVYLKVIHTELLYRLTNIEFDLLDFKVRTQVSDIIHKKYLKQKTKLNRLLKNIIYKLYITYCKLNVKSLPRSLLLYKSDNIVYVTTLLPKVRFDEHLNEVTCKLKVY